MTIRGLSITKFDQGILAFVASSGHLIENNVIGSNRSFASGLGNAAHGIPLARRQQHDQKQRHLRQLRRADD